MDKIEIYYSVATKTGIVKNATVFFKSLVLEYLMLYGGIVPQYGNGDEIHFCRIPTNEFTDLCKYCFDNSDPNEYSETARVWLAVKS